MIKVLLGINTYPGHLYCRDEFVSNFKAMVKDAYDNGINVKVLILWNGRQKPKGFEGYETIIYTPLPKDRGIDILYKKQNMIRDYLLKGDYDYLYSLESDTLPPRDTITAHVNSGKDAVSCVYFIEAQNQARVTIPDTPYYRALGFGDDDMSKKAAIIENKLQPSIWGVFGNKSRLWTIEDCFPQRGLVRAFASGVGAVLLRTSILEHIKFKIRGANEIQQFTDFLLFMDVHHQGYELFIDTDRIAQHLHYDFDGDISVKWFNVDTLESTTPNLPKFNSKFIQVMTQKDFPDKVKPLKEVPAMKILDEAIKVLGDTPHWLSTGTLLGIVRDGELLKWDKDIDIDVYGDTNPLELMKRFEDKGFKAARTMTFKGRIMQTAFFKEEVIIDIHYFWDDGYRSWVNYTEAGSLKFPNYLFSNLSKIKFNGGEYSAPANPEEYLKINYKNWKKVVKGKHYKTYTNFDERS